MSAAFKKGRNFQVYVPTRTGFAQRSTGTADVRVVRDMKRKVAELKDAREWDVLDAIRDCRVTLGEVYDAMVGKCLDDLKARLADVNLTEHLEGWERWVAANSGVARTANYYRQQVASLTGAEFYRSELTPGKIGTWLTGLPVSTGTRRKYLYALRSFVRYLFEQGVLVEDPTLTVRRPKKNKARLRWEPLEMIQRIVDAQPEPYRSLAALREATGAEITAALEMKRRDLDLEAMVAHVPGTKTGTRDRHQVLIESWARAYLERHYRGLLPNALLFSGITRYTAYEQHVAACEAVKVEDYTMHDCRHSWAVRARKRGVSLEGIAAQLGHASLASTMLYAKFEQTLEERQKEAIR